MSASPMHTRLPGLALELQNRGTKKPEVCALCSGAARGEAAAVAVDGYHEHTWLRAWSPTSLTGLPVRVMRAMCPV